MIPLNRGVYKIFKVPDYAIIDKIEGFSTLPEGWSHGEGIPPKKNELDLAKKVARYAINKLLSVDSVPGFSGQIQVVIYGKSTKKDKYLEIDFEPENKFNITKYIKTGNTWNIVEDEELKSLSDVKCQIDKFGKELLEWKTLSEFYQKSTFLKSWEGTRAKPLKTIKEEYPSFKSYASLTQVPMSVAI